MKTMSIEDKLAVNKYDIDRDAHIKVNASICQTCQSHPCVFVCPASCFKPTEEHLTFSYEGCLECGSCRITCERGAIEWILPRPGFGICYEYG